MPEEKITFKVGETVYDIPPDKRDAFVGKYPDAIELKSFVAGRDTFDIPLDRVNAFLEKHPDAKPTFGLGKPSAVAQPGGGGGLPLRGTPGQDGGTSQFGIGSVAEKIGKPIPPATTRQSKVEPQQVSTPTLTGPQGLDLSGLPSMEESSRQGDVNAMMPAQGRIKNLIPPTQQELIEGDPFLGYKKKKEEIANIPDEAKRRFETGKAYERMAQAKQSENKDLEQMLSQGRQMLEGQAAELESLTEQINQTQDPNERQQLTAAYNEVGQIFENAKAEYDGLYKKYQDNAKFAATMLKGAGAMGGSDLSGLESFAYGGYGVGVSMVKSLGEIIKGADYVTSLGQGGYFEQLGDAISNLADRAKEKSEIAMAKKSKDIQKDVFEDLNWDNAAYVAGQLTASIMSVVGGGAVAGVRGGQVIAGSQVFGDAVQTGRDAGFDEGGALLFALPVTLAAAYFSDKGVEAMSGYLKGAGKGAMKKAIQELGEKPTAQAILQAGTNFAKNTVEGAVKEGLQEGLEFSTEFGSKKLAEQMPDISFKEDLSMDAFAKGFMQNTALGAAGGTAFGGIFGASPRNKIASIASEAVKTPAKSYEFLENVKTFEAAGEITAEQAQEAIQIFEKAKSAASQVPPTVTNPEQAATATELIMEQQDREAQLQTVNPAMRAPIQARLDEVNAELGSIAEESVAPAREKIGLQQESEAQEAIKAQREARDKEVEAIAAIRPDLTDSDILLVDLPPIVEKTIDRMDAAIPSDPTQVQESIDALDKKFDELEAYKKDPKRTHTTEQIDEVIDLLGEAKTELQLYQEQLAGYEREQGTTKETGAEATGQGVAKTAPDEKGAAVQETAAVTATDFAPFGERGKKARREREAVRKKFGDEAYKKMDDVTRNFESIIKDLEAQGKIRKVCP